MAISPMAKILIVSHRSQATDLLEALQQEGICQILSADEAVVAQDLGEVKITQSEPKDIETLISRLDRSIAFLSTFAETEKGLAAMLAPRTVVDRQAYENAVTDTELLKVVRRAERTQDAIQKCESEMESLRGTLDTLEPWAALETPVEELCRLHKASCMIGLVPSQAFDALWNELTERGAALQKVGSVGNKVACLVVALPEHTDLVQKALRAVEFESVSFDGMSGAVGELIDQHRQRLIRTEQNLYDQKAEAAELSKNLLKLQILDDHYKNLLRRTVTQSTAPATANTVMLEGWVRQRHYDRLEQVVSRFGAAALTRVKLGPDEEPPVEIENRNAIRPFEVITRLYGMPRHFEVDPTVFLAPFFAVFFALCLTDAGYGLVMVILAALLVKRMQGDTRLMWMLGICGAATVVAGALTGGWFGDAIQKFIPGMEGKQVALWFDPMKDPMIFFYMSLALGYFQLMFGLGVAFVHSLKQKEYASAICDSLAWLVMINSVVLYLGAGFGALPKSVGSFFGYVALVPAAIVLLFSHREGGWGGRIGMGVYNLFSTIFYMGDVLSYLRLMALGMVTAGLAMAINVIVQICADIPWIGIVIGLLVFVGGHLFNLAINALGAFVHTLRLQYVEFFPKFFVGGGRTFKPLSKQYEHIYIQRDT